MNPILRNILAVIAALIVGVVVNAGLITISPELIPPPEGVDVMDVESIKAHLHLYQPKHFIFPFLAHALGTLAGAYVVSRMAINHYLKLAIGIGVFFFIGGIMTAQAIPAPTWFLVSDLVGAYFPMAWLGWKLAGGNFSR